MLRQHFLDFQTLVEQGKTIEAIDKWYATEIVQIENTDEPIKGKEVLRQYEAQSQIIHQRFYDKGTEPM